ncbi:MAG: response regulator [Pseudomonadota bacterium]
MMLDDRIDKELAAQVSVLEDRSCLVMDDDTVFRERLAQSLTRYGFIVSAVGTVRDGLTVAKHNPPAFAVLDLRLDDGFGLDVAQTLRETSPSTHMVVLTGYGALPNVVASVKIGVQNVLSKPADIEDVINSLLAAPRSMPSPPETPMDPDDARWEYIQSVYNKNGRNVSQTARLLNMHRRTLQRIIQRRSPDQLHIRD